ncbi:MAG TPA: site-2 protease family protein [Planctomycetota bacterium]
MDPILLIGGILVVVFSITTHEAAHAWVADRLGDPTARMLGRVTLNPIPHIDPFMTLVLPGLLFLSGSAVLFGGAKPVPVQMHNLRRPNRDWALVGAAGPVSNILLAFGFAGFLTILLRSGIYQPVSSGSQVLSLAILVNVLLAVFNLVPIPPLDGSRVLRYFLSPSMRESFERLERVGLFIVMGLVFFVPSFRAFVGKTMFWCIDSITSIYGIRPEVTRALNALFA